MALNTTPLPATWGTLCSAMIYTLAAYFMWSVFPGFFPLLLPAGPVEILAHRIIWTAVFMLIIVWLSSGLKELRGLSLKSWGWLAAASIAISVNWGTYVLAVNSNHVADAALGYFINPLVSVALAVIFLKERLRRNQLIAVAVAAVAVIWLAFMTGQVPLLALSLAFSFGIYGLIKKQVNVSAAASVAAEAVVMSPLALVYIIVIESQGTGTFFAQGPGHAALLMAAGIVTGLPLLCFSAGAKLLPLATVGMLQYITPIMQLLWAVYITKESFSAERWMGFAILAVAVIIYVADLLMAHRREVRRRLPDAES